MSMIVTAWNNGAQHVSGAGYGIKINMKDREHFFRKKWNYIFLELEGEKERIKVNTKKASFWKPSCGELIKKEIGCWLIQNRMRTWKKGNPPKIKMEKVRENVFKVNLPVL